MSCRVAWLAQACSQSRSRTRPSAVAAVGRATRWTLLTLSIALAAANPACGTSSRDDRERPAPAASEPEPEALELEPWRRDYEVLRDFTAKSYANLQWSARRGLDLAALHRRTLDELNSARTEDQARAALYGFVAAFEDGHFRLHPGGEDASSEPEIWSLPMAATRACRALGFDDRSTGVLDFAREHPATTVMATPGHPFPALVRPLADGRRLGLIWLPLFAARGYLGTCLQVWPRFQQWRRRCDDACRNEFRYQAMVEVLLDAFADRLRALQAAGIDALVVDLSRNGGGTDWTDAIARMLTGQPVHCRPMAVIRHPHWRARIDHISQRLPERLPAGASSEDGSWLLRARERLHALSAEIDASCDLTPLWHGEDPGCQLLTTTRTTSCGLLSWMPPTVLTELPGREYLHAPIEHHRRAGLYTGPLVLLTSRQTASASEQLVSALSQHAVIVGERTAGIGCGYVSGGVSVRLPHSGLLARAPDCARFLANGDNERAGIAPDVERINSKVERLLHGTLTERLVRDAEAWMTDVDRVRPRGERETTGGAADR